MVQTVRGVGYRIGPEGGAVESSAQAGDQGLGRFSLARLDLRARVVLFTSAIVVGALLLLGAALHALLAKSLYTQQNFDAVQQVKLLTRPAEVGDVTGLDTAQVDSSRTSSSGGWAASPASRPWSCRARTGPGPPPTGLGSSTSRPTWPSGWGAKELAYVYIRSPAGPGRMLVVGAPIRLDQDDAGIQQAYFFYPLNFQEETLAKLNFLLIVGAGLLAAVVILAAISIGRVLKPIQRAWTSPRRSRPATWPPDPPGDQPGRLRQAGRVVQPDDRQPGPEDRRAGARRQPQARFVSDVSHELRTPLATVRMAADYIHAARAGLPPDAQRAAVLLERELERFENLLEDLLEISRFDAGVINLEPVEVDLAGLLDEVVDALDPIAHGRKVDVALEIDRSQGLPLVAADPRRLDRVFSNLVKNAIEHTVEAGSGSGSAGAPATWSSPSPTRARASRPRTCPTSSSASTGPTSTGPGPSAAPGSGWPSPSRT